MPKLCGWYLLQRDRRFVHDLHQWHDINNESRGLHGVRRRLFLESGAHPMLAVRPGDPVGWRHLRELPAGDRDWLAGRCTMRKVQSRRLRGEERYRRVRGVRDKVWRRLHVHRWLGDV